MSPKSAPASPWGTAAVAFVASWLAYTTILRPQPAPRLAPQPTTQPPAPPAPTQNVPAPAPVVEAQVDVPTLKLLQHVRVTCAGVTFEGTINSIYIEDGWARLSLVDQIPEPVNPGLWSWEDEGSSAGN